MVKINNLNFSYDNSSGMIHNLCLSIPKGSYTSIIGENGSCKSTLIKLILGLLTPDSGTINVGTSRIGYVPQWLDGFNSQFPITVNEVLLTHFKCLKLKDKSIINTSLNEVGMAAFKNSLIGSLSGGQKQKILIARALLGKPELLILDEPSTGIDTKSQADIYKLIKKLNKEQNVTVIAVEHNMNAVLKNSTLIYRLENGKAMCCDIDEFKNKYLKEGGYYNA